MLASVVALASFDAAVVASWSVRVGTAVDGWQAVAVSVGFCPRQSSLSRGLNAAVTKVAAAISGREGGPAAAACA